MERKIIENGTTFRWHNSKEELPNLKNENDTLTCVVKRNGHLASVRQRSVGKSNQRIDTQICIHRCTLVYP